MKKGLKEELILAKKALIQARSTMDYDNIINMMNNIYNIQNDLFINKKSTYKYTKLINLGTMNPNQELLELIQQLVNIYADMPLLETESSIDYPTLNTIKDKKIDVMLKFWNYVYTSEIPKLEMPLFTFRNVDIIDCSAIKRIFINGKCMVYHSFKLQQPKLILKKFYTIKDFINPCGAGILMLPNINCLDYNNTINIMQHYMRAKSLQMYHEFNSREVDKLNLLINDNLIYEARTMKKMLSFGWDNLSLFYKGKILDFTNQIIGMQLSERNDITLEQLLPQNNSNFDKSYSLELLNSSNNEIIENSKQLALKYKRRDIREKNIYKKTIK